MSSTMWMTEIISGLEITKKILSQDQKPILNNRKLSNLEKNQTPTE